MLQVASGTKRRLTNGQLTHGNVLPVTSHHGNGTQSHSETPPHTHYAFMIKKNSWQGCEEPGSFLMLEGRHTGAARGNSMLLPKNYTESPYYQQLQFWDFPRGAESRDAKRHLHLHVRSSATHDGQRQKPPCHGHHCVLGTMQYCSALERVGFRHTYNLEEPWRRYTQ